MDIGLKEWLIIGGVLVIGLIIFDGWRRMKGQRNTLRMEIDKSLSDSEESVPGVYVHNPELPNGGARMLKDFAKGDVYVPNSEPVVHTSTRIEPGFEHLNDHSDDDSKPQSSLQTTHQQPDLIDDLSEKIHSNAGLDPLFDDIPEIISPVRKVVIDEKAVITSKEQSAFLDLEQPITVLMRQAAEKTEESDAQEHMFFYPETPHMHQAEEIEKCCDDDVREDPIASNMGSVPESTIVEESIDSDDVNVFDLPYDEQDEQIVEGIAASPTQSELNMSDSVSPSEQDSLFESDLLEHARSDRKAREHAPEPEEVLVITVVGKQQPLDGQTLLQVVLACGMRHGDMSLFHRFEEGIDKGAVQFSMANAVNPGTFDLENMSEMTTPGVSFFMSMNEPADVKNAFECMLATAETVSKHLGGDLLDENRSVMRPQTKAHYRERIREYELHNRHRRK